MTPWTEATAHANGIDVHYLRTGGGGPPVVLLHGLTDNGACWTRLARELEADYDLVMPDARGHGRSSAPEGGYSPADRAADVVALIGALGLQRPALIGHSMGGLTAAIVAADAPGLIRGAILEDPAFLPPESRSPNARAEWAARHAEELAMSEEELAARGRADMPRWSPDTFGPWARAKHQTSPRVFAWLDEPPVDVRPIVARIGVPTLLVIGDPARGAIVSAAAGAELQALSPHLRVARLPEAGHCIRYEQPAQFAAVARAFLDELFG
jgi:pimeloyl-ACP methyl ester carboxylesterase